MSSPNLQTAPIEYRYAPAETGEIVAAAVTEIPLAMIFTIMIIGGVHELIFGRKRVLNEVVIGVSVIITIGGFIFYRMRSAYIACFLRKKYERIVLLENSVLYVGPDGRKRVEIPFSELKSIEPQRRSGPYNNPVYMISSAYQSIPLYPKMYNSDQLIENLRIRNPAIRFQELDRLNR